MLTVKENPKSLLAEAYRGLRTSLEYTSVDKKLKTLVVTSSNPGEGKSTVSGNLAFVLAQGGKKVIIVDADLRKPTIHKKFRVANTAGLTDCLIGKKKVNEVVNKIEDNVHIITAGQKTPNPAEMVSSKAMEDLIAALKDVYDYVIIDTPPVRNINDGVVLSAKVDGTILVVRAGVTKSVDIVKGYKELEKVKSNVVGTVLNAVENKKDSYYYYYYED